MIKQGSMDIKQPKIPQTTSSLCIGSKHKGDTIAINDIVFIQAFGNYTWIHLLDGKKLLSSKTIGFYKNLLDTRSFNRIHRSYLINISHIKHYEYTYRLVHLKGEISLPVSYRKNKDFSKSYLSN